MTIVRRSFSVAMSGIKKVKADSTKHPFRLPFNVVDRGVLSAFTRVSLSIQTFNFDLGIVCLA